MELRLLGRSGLQVSSLGLGAMTFGGGGASADIGTVQAEEALEFVHACFESGVNLFDTADVYGGGMSEVVLGQALRDHRDEVLIATKSFMAAGPGPNQRGSSRSHIVDSCEASLRRLGTDWIDLYQVHLIDELAAPEVTMSALDELVRSGKVRYVGCSNYSAWHVMRALAAADARGLERFASLQAYYSLLGRDVENEHIPMCLAEGLGLLVWSPLAGGLLTGKVTREAPPAIGTRLSVRSPPGDQIDASQMHLILDVMRELAETRGVSVAQVGLNWVRARRGVSSVLIGARNVSQLRDNLAAATWELTAGEIERLDTASARPLPYPYSHQQRWGAERLSWSRRT